ncbi:MULTISPECIES: hypothetical protein [Leifsonia]|uniref:Uncharacterized protein n=1 Tax=Leifsonia shinshuensis TaxID=150026 RepID=A0A853D5D1_9MICO|nr:MULTISPECIES: hypothetical protein [Leifsonia]MBO1740713.1 hypothetical protein [Leifsonia sp. TF02-11]NYJ25835.1 hypothetical protein [Leifsonia shinshuensis]
MTSTSRGHRGGQWIHLLWSMASALLDVRKPLTENQITTIAGWRHL